MFDAEEFSDLLRKCADKSSQKSQDAVSCQGPTLAFEDTFNADLKYHVPGQSWN